MKKLLLCTLIFTMGVSCLLLSGCTSDLTTTAAVSQNKVKEKKYVKAEGTILSTEHKVVSSDKTGEVEVKVKVGQEVSKDDVLVKYKDGETLVCPYEKAVVTEVFATDGEVIEGGKKILSISNTNTKVVNAEVLERNIKYIQEGCEAKIVSNADSSKSFEGKVKNISNCAFKREDGNTIVAVQVSIDDEDINNEFLREGYTVSLRINKK